MLTARENQIICRDLQIVGSRRKMRAQCSTRGSRWEYDILGYACIRPGPLLICLSIASGSSLGDWAACINLAGRVDDPR